MSGERGKGRGAIAILKGGRTRLGGVNLKKINWLKWNFCLDWRIMKIFSKCSPGIIHFSYILTFLEKGKKINITKEVLKS